MAAVALEITNFCGCFLLCACALGLAVPLPLPVAVPVPVPVQLPVPVLVLLVMFKYRLTFSRRQVLYIFFLLGQRKWTRKLTLTTTLVRRAVCYLHIYIHTYVYVFVQLKLVMKGNSLELVIFKQFARITATYCMNIGIHRYKRAYVCMYVCKNLNCSSNSSLVVAFVLMIYCGPFSAKKYEEVLSCYHNFQYPKKAKPTQF